MRRCFTIPGFVLMLTSFGCAASTAPIGAPAAHTATESSVRVWTEMGREPTQNEAEQQAQQNAHDAVIGYLHERFPDLNWTPTKDELVRFGVIVVRSEETKPGAWGNLNGFEATAHVDVTDPKLRKMQEQIDEARKSALEPTVSWRHALVGRVLGSLVALFLVVFGYLRLEELTRGYYTLLLRLGAVGVMLTVVGLFLVF
jgi:hypothetical protein